MSELPQSVWFWAAAAGMAAAAIAFVLPGLVRAREVRGRVSRAAMNAAILRGQVADLRRDRETGLLSAEQHAEARAELQRRALAEAGDEVVPAAGRPQRWLVFALAAGLPAAALAIYLLLGDPQALDRASSESGPGATASELQAHLTREPRDARAWVLLARLEFSKDRFDVAADAYGKALGLSQKVARDPAVWCEYADALGMSQGGRLAGPPRELIERALAIDSKHPKALEMAGSAAYERMDFGKAVHYWQALLAQLPDASPAHRELAAAIARARRLAGTD